MRLLKKISLLLLCLYYFNLSTGNAQEYRPRFWVDEPEKINEVIQRGWGGILYWGATFEEDKMHYYYPSKYLERKPWAVRGKDNLTALIKTAHQNGLKVMVNMEGVNPYHWAKNKWTTETITATASDLAATGIDAVFEECFEANPAVFSALAQTLNAKKVDYVSGTDPMLLREYSFKQLWPQTSIINLYNYYLKRDKSYSVATLAQQGSLGLGWAKYWGKPTAMMSPITRDWGIDMQKSPAVVSYIAMIRALQFRIDNFYILGGLEKFDPIATQSWITAYVNKQEAKRPLMNIIVLLDQEDTKPNTEQSGWNKLFNSADAITTGAFHAGYNVIVSDKVLPADAYWVYSGNSNKDLPTEVADLFNSDKKVFLQSSGHLPSGKTTHQWISILAKCGVNAKINFNYAGSNSQLPQVSLPEDQDLEIPYTGYFKNNYLRFTGTDIQRGIDFRGGTIIPQEAIEGIVYSSPNTTYGKGPYMIGKNNKYLITTNALHWQTAYPISNLLARAGTLPSSNVWGIVGKNVTALLAIETTELNLTLPDVPDGATLHYVVWDSSKNKSDEKTITYKAPFVYSMKEYDFILIDKVLDK